MWLLPTGTPTSIRKRTNSRHWVGLLRCGWSLIDFDISNPPRRILNTNWYSLQAYSSSSYLDVMSYFWRRRCNHDSLPLSQNPKRRSSEKGGQETATHATIFTVWILTTLACRCLIRNAHSRDDDDIVREQFHSYYYNLHWYVSSFTSSSFQPCRCFLHYTCKRKEEEEEEEEEGFLSSPRIQSHYSRHGCWVDGAAVRLYERGDKAFYSSALRRSRMI